MSDLPANASAERVRPGAAQGSLVERPHGSTELPPGAALLGAMWELWHALVPAGEARLGELGLSLRGFIALGHLQAGARSPAELAGQLGLPRYEMSRVLQGLEQSGLLRRERGTGPDGRRVQVQTTGAGRERWRQGLDAVEGVTAPRLAALNPDDLARLTAALRSAARPHPPTRGEP